MTSTLRLMRVLDRVSERQRPILPWPDPEESIGTFYQSLGRYHCWEMRGKAREIYLRLAGDIKLHLESYGDIVSATVIWSAFMVGKSKQCANPTVFFCSKDSKARRAVRSEIDNSGILATYPGFRTGDCTRPPHLSQLRQLASGGDEASESCPAHSHTTCHNPIGRRIQVKSDATKSSPTPATIGAVLESGELLYFTTAAHAFIELDGDPFECESPTDSAFEWDFDCEHDELVEADMRQAVTDIIHSPVPHDRDATDLRRGTETSFFQSQDVRFSSASTPTPDSHLDYCLVEFKRDDPRLTDATRSSSKPCTYHTAFPKDVAREGPMEGDVIAFTGSKQASHGKLSGTPSFMVLAGGRFSQELWTVNLDGKLEDGDCGSIVISASSGNLEGHIIAGDPRTGSALIVPAYQMLRDVQLRFDSSIRLFQMGQCTDLQRLVAKDVTTGAPEHSEAAVEPLARENVGDEWAADITIRFRRMLSEQRIEKLKAWRGYAFPTRPEVFEVPEKEFRQDKSDDPPSAAPPPYEVQIHNIPREPKRPTEWRALRFRNLLVSLSALPCKWENPGLLDEALAHVPLQRIYDEAQEQIELLTAEAESLEKGSNPTWGYQDCVIRALLRWFRRDFFSWVNNPVCSVCYGPTIAMGMGQPTVDERARDASRVEVFQCSDPVCHSYERFPRHQDAFILLQTRRGRVGEWANCFSMLCRALGSRVRWVWNAEDHVWTEVYSSHQQRWVHVDSCEEAWDRPLLYTEVWGKKMSYCIAFSTDGCFDVTGRYVRDHSIHGLPREKCPEEVLWHIAREITALRRVDRSDDELQRLRDEDRREEQALRQYIIEALVPRMLDRNDVPERIAGEKGTSSTEESTTRTEESKARTGESRARARFGRSF